MIRRLGSEDLERVGIDGLVRPQSRLVELGAWGKETAALLVGPLAEEAREQGLILFLVLPDVVEYAHLSAVILKAWMALGFDSLWLERGRFCALCADDDQAAVLRTVGALCLWNFYTRRSENCGELYPDAAKMVLRVRRKPGRVTVLGSDCPLREVARGFAPGLESWLRRNAIELAAPAVDDPLARRKP